MRRPALLTAVAVVSLVSVATAAFARPKHGHSARSPRGAVASASRAEAPVRVEVQGRAEAPDRVEPSSDASAVRAATPPAGRATLPKNGSGPSTTTLVEAPSLPAPRPEGTATRTEQTTSDGAAERDDDVGAQPVPNPRTERGRERQPAARAAAADQDESRRGRDRTEPAAGSMPAASSAAARPAASVTVASIEVEGGEVPRAQASLERLAAGELTACTADPSALRGEATLRVKFLVRGLGRVEGLDLTDARGVPRSVARCMMATLDRRHLGDASDDPVALAVVFRLVPRR